MKKTISINLSGIIFYIEEDGFELLREYLENIRLQFKNKEEADMILEDVEIRIAELFNEKLSDSKTAILSTDVKEVISIMGDASDYSLEDDEKIEETESTTAHTKTDNRKLYRDPENGSIGGVATGLAHYFNIEVTILRVIFILFVLAGLSGFLIYLVLWILLPKVNSTSDRLKMNGIPITVENISKEAKDAALRLEKSTKQFSTEFTQKVEPRFKRLGEILSKIIGIGLVFFCAFLLTAFLIFTIGNFGLIGAKENQELLSLYDLSLLVLQDGTVNLAWISISVAVLCPLVAFIVLGLTLLFKFQTKTTKKIYLSLLGLWIIAFISGGIIATKNGLQMAQEEKIEEELLTLQTNTVELKWQPLSGEKRRNDFRREEILKTTEDSIYLPVSRIKIYPSADSNTHVYLQKSAHGSVTANALDRIDNITFNTQIDSNVIELPAYFAFPKTDNIRNQDVVIIVEIPVNASTTVDFGLEKRTFQLENSQDYIHVRKFDYNFDAEDFNIRKRRY